MHLHECDLKQRLFNVASLLEVCRQIHNVAVAWAIEHIIACRAARCRPQKLSIKASNSWWMVACTSRANLRADTLRTLSFSFSTCCNEMRTGLN